MPENPGYGFIDPATPEIAMGVAPSHRSAGVGRALLAALIAEALDAGVPALSLSVEADNYALVLYAGAGFKQVGERDGSVMMFLQP